MWNQVKSAWRWYVVAALPTMAILAVRSMGWLQPVEWTALDIYFQLRPTEAIQQFSLWNLTRVRRDLQL